MFQTIFTRKCKGCDFVCEISHSSCIDNDKDSIECPKCNTTVYSWEGRECNILLNTPKVTRIK